MFIDIDTRIFEEIIHSSKDGIWSIDDQFRILAINPAAVDLIQKAFGVRFSVGQNLNDLRKNPRFETLISELETALEGNHFTEQDSLFIAEGERVFETSFSPIKKDDLVTGVAVVSREITELSYFTRLGRSKFRELQVLNTISTKVSQARTVDELFDECSNIVSEAVSPAKCWFIFYDKKAGMLHRHRNHIQKSDASTQINIRVEKGITGWVARNGVSRFVPDTKLDPDYYELDAKTRSELCVPILVNDEVYGIINLESEEINAFASEDEQLLKTIANNIATSIERINLFEKTERKSQEMSALYKTALVTSSELDSTVLVKKLNEQILELFKPDVFLLALYDHKSHEMELLMADTTGKKLPELTNKQLTVKETGLMSWVMKTRQTLLTQELHVDKLPEVAIYDEKAKSGSWLGTWLIGREHLLGAITLQSHKTNAFDKEHKQLLASMASQVAVALENARLFEAENQRVKELAAISTLSLAMREARDRKELLSILLDELTRTVNADAIALITKDAATNQQVSEFATGKWNLNSGSAIPDDLFIDENIWKSSTPVVINSISQSDPIAKSPWMKEIDSLIGLPLSLQGENIGIIWIGRNESFSDEETRILTALADIAASAIRRTTLNDQTTRQLQQLASLHDIDLAITGSSDIKVTLDFLLGSALTQLEMDGAIIQSLNPFSQTLNCITSRGIYDTRILRSFSRMGDDLAGQCAMDRRLIQEPNLEKTSVYSARARLFKDAGFNSYYAIPLIAKGQVKGVMEVFSQTHFKVTSEWINFFTMLSTQAAIAIDNGELFDNLQRSNMDLMVAYDSTLEGWASALELRDEETEGHARRVTEMTERLAMAIGVKGQELNNIRRGALLHDIGKMGIPDQILLKPGPLSEDEWKIMRTHPELAYNLISPISFLRPAVDIPLYHHEKWDGTGYPRGLKGTDIPVSARLFAIIDVWDALSSDRPYRKAWDIKKVYEYLQSQSGSHFDPDILKVFLTQVLGKP